ncbi:hypothetical protein AL479_23575 [Citrobacter amalonaticus]|nr:hypothetical protein AL479_23575 [Citrobacter amalonaticus]
MEEWCLSGRSVYALPDSFRRNEGRGGMLVESGTAMPGAELQATKNPSTLNQNGGVDGLHKLGTSKKSSGNSYD